MFKITNKDKLIYRLEADNKKRIKAFLKTLSPDGFFFTIPQNKLSKAGIADTLGIYNGVLFAIEVKSLEGKPTALQKVFLRAIVRAGGIAGIARCVADVKILLSLSCIINGIYEGHRHNSALILSSIFKKFMSSEQILATLVRWNKRNTPELPESELEKIIAAIIISDKLTR
uniref:VRR-NUC domain-containing protein n=1 Tax=viral metagenome TaxID=1070528 RepID=A0A6M3K7X8_9ZZZZ